VFPNLSRSRSQKSKKQRYAFDVIKEQNVEDDPDYQTPRTCRIKYSFSSKFLPEIRLKTKNNQTSKEIDPILEVKEESDKFFPKMHESPRIKLMTDFKEDTYSTKFLNTHYNKYDIFEEIIAEDNNENIVENEKTKKPITDMIDDVDPIKEVFEEEEHNYDLNTGNDSLF
jgi:hypothetical protein